MPRGQGRGGYRKPDKPAPVSGPGALSQRTDGGPGDPQPIRLASGGKYGDRKASQAQQSAAPMAGGSPLPQPAAGGGAPSPVSPPAPIDAFAPTARPDEPITAGMPFGPGRGSLGMLPTDPDEALRIAYSMFRHPDIAELLADRAQG